MLDRRYFRYFDWISFLLMLALLSIGLLFVFSSTYKEEISFSLFFKKQIFGAVTGLVIYFFACMIDLRSLARWGYFGTFLVLFLLTYTMIGGWIGMGAKRWISLYFLTFQPSELVKLSLPTFFAYYFNEQQNNPLNTSLSPPLREFAFPIMITVLSLLLILKQPDLGTALIILFSGTVLLWVANINKKFFIIVGMCGILAAPVMWKTLKPYQKERIMVLLGHGHRQKERYQIEQSKIAIGSGGMTGKGWLKGTQNRLSFLPEARTDFIFSVVCEEWGFLGAALVLLLFLLLFIRLTYITTKVPGIMEQLIAVGLLAYIMISVCINIGMVTEILPIVGIPLPLFTYGITQLWVTMASLGMLNNIAIRRFYY